MNVGVYCSCVQFNDSRMELAKLGATKFSHELGNGICTGRYVLFTHSSFTILPGPSGLDSRGGPVTVRPEIKIIADENMRQYT